MLDMVFVVAGIGCIALMMLLLNWCSRQLEENE